MIKIGGVIGFVVVAYMFWDKPIGQIPVWAGLIWTISVLIMSDAIAANSATEVIQYHVNANRNDDHLDY